MTIPFASIFPFLGIYPWEIIRDGKTDLQKRVPQHNYICKKTRNHLDVQEWRVSYVNCDTPGSYENDLVE